MTPLEEESNQKYLFASAWLAACKDMDHAKRADILSSTSIASYESDSLLAIFLEDKCRQFGSKPRSKSGFARAVDNASRLADEWAACGIRIVFPDSGIKGPIYISGDPAILEKPSAAIINSRKPRRIIPGDAWLNITENFFLYALKSGMAVNTGLGNPQYEILCYLALKKEAELAVYCDDVHPLMDNPKKRAVFFEKYSSILNFEKTLLASTFSPGKLPDRKTRLVARDETVIFLADRIFVVEIRPGGNMERTAAQAMAMGRDVIVQEPNRFDKVNAGARTLLGLGARSWRAPADNSRASIAGKGSHVKKWTAPEKPKKIIFEDSDGLIHFTRENPGPWPGQSLEDYYESLITGRPEAAHTAFDALNRILDEKLIRGGRRMSRGGLPIVSFTACTPDLLKELISWRPALIRWTFEPYGLAFKKTVLEKAGALPVIYGNEKAHLDLPIEQQFRFHLCRPDAEDWSREQEWRLPGDLDFRHIRPEDMRVIVPSKEEAEIVSDRYGLKAISLGFRRR